VEIRFGVWKKEKVKGKNKTISRNDGIELPITMEQFENDRFNVHRMVMEAVYNKYPGWVIMGYCPKGYGRE